MILKLLLSIAYRYLWTKHNFGFITFSTIFSIVGMVFGISSLIIISCISDGFNYTINSKLSKVDGHLRIYNYIHNKVDRHEIDFIDSLISLNKNLVNYSSEYIEERALIKYGSVTKSVIVYGVPEKTLEEIFYLNEFTEFPPVFNNNNSVIIGSQLSEDLSVNIGQNITLINPIKLGFNNSINLKNINIDNVFKTNFPEYDRLLIYIPLKLAQDFFNYKNNVSGVIVNCKDDKYISTINNFLNNNFQGTLFSVSTWKDRHSNLLKWLNVYDVPIKLIVLFIIIVAIFNSYSTLWMIIIEKKKEYSVLLALGLSKNKISIIVFIQGLIISIISSAIAILLSFFILYFEKIFHFIVLPDDIYFMSYLPIKISFMPFLVYPLLTVIANILFIYFPLKNTFSNSISDSLRYE